MNKTFITAQLFAVFKSTQSVWQSRKSWNNRQFYQVQGISPKELCALREDLIAYWDEHYPSLKYPPPERYKNTMIDTDSNRFIQKKHFTKLPHVKALVTKFEILYQELEIKSVWFIKKSRCGDGFQRWHQDLVGIGTAAATIFLNIDSVGREEGENEKQPQPTTEADATNLYLAILEDQEKADSLANCLPVDFRKLQDIYDSASEDKLHKITRFYLLNGLDRWICTSCKIEASSLSARCQGCKSYIPFVPLEIAEFENFVICKRRDMPHWGKESVRRVISNISQAQLQSLSDQGLHEEEEEEEEGEEEGEGDKTGAGATGAKLV